MNTKLLVLFLLLSITRAITQPIAPTPSRNIIAFNNYPLTMLPLDGSLLVGGWFVQCSEYNTGYAMVDPISGEILNDFNLGNGSGTVIKDSIGKYYYLLVGGAPPVQHGAAILQKVALDGTVEESIPLFVEGVGIIPAAIECLTVANDTVYIGGRFSKINGVSRNSLAAINITTGAVLDFAASADSNVRSMVIYGDDLIIGGVFDTVSGQPRTALARINRYDGEIHDWAIMPTALMRTTFSNLVFGYRRLIISKGVLYTIRGAIDAATGAPKPWKPNPENIPVAPYPIPSIYDIDVSAGRIVVVGEFTGMNGEKRNGIAIFDEETGDLTEVNPNAEWLNPYSFLSASYSTVRCAGSVAYIGGWDTFLAKKPIDGLGACDIITGEVQDWNIPCLRRQPGGQSNSQVLYADNQRVFVTGALGSVGKPLVKRAGLVELSNAGDAVLPWNPKFSKIVIPHISDTIPQVLSLLLVNNTIYVGGNFDSVNGFARKNLCAFDRVTRQLLPWNPTAQGSVVNTILHDNGTLYIAGLFDSINGTAQRFIGAIDAATGEVWTFNITVDTSVTTMAIHNGRLYISGVFRKVNNQERNGFAVLDLENGLVLQEGPTLPAQAEVSAMVVTDSIVYLSGTRLGSDVTPISSPLGGRMALAGYDRITGTVRWKPQYDIPTNVKAISLQLYNGILYAGGLMRNSPNNGKSYITTIGIFQYDLSTGKEVGRMLTATAPTILRIANDTLFTSGKFNDENGWVGMDYFARFDAKKSVGVKVADAQQDDALQVWPNPASNFLVVETQGGGNSPLQIITLQGEIAAEYAVEDHTLLPITHLPVGTYLLRIGERTTPVTIKR